MDGEQDSVDLVRLGVCASLSLLVAESFGTLSGVCMWRDDGWILLNHGSPDARYSGVSKAMLDHMASRMRQRGLKRCHPKLSLTALPLYLAAGFEASKGYLGTGRCCASVSFDAWPMACKLVVSSDGCPLLTGFA